ncbi:MAG: hypothetical protein A2Y97_05565 [Nitrospirae bacterium RBG_13_39_12]|nr:MAG: hypothetical protein A2Y97_05565 [Nitrospirae bacterium RBG_13_39_12]
MDKEESPIFVVGMPRSGTTLISAMLTSHPNIAISPETHFLSEWIRRYRRLDVRREKDFNKFWGRFGDSSFFRNLQLDAETVRNQILSSGDHDYKDIFSTILKLYAEKKNKRRWGEKTPTHYAHIHQLLEWHPESRIVYMVRDPRAVVASRLDMSEKYPLSWWHPRTVEDISFQWRNSINILNYWANDNRIYPIIYEKLIQDTLSELRRLCGFIGEEYSLSMLSYTEVAKDLVANDPWKESVFKPIIADSIDKWRLKLLTDEISTIEYVSRKGMNQFMYQMVGKPHGFFKKFRLNIANTIRIVKMKLIKRTSLL